jgi:hypothetical protein
MSYSGATKRLDDGAFRRLDNLRYRARRLFIALEIIAEQLQHITLHAVSRNTKPSIRTIRKL